MRRGALVPLVLMACAAALGAPLEAATNASTSTNASTAVAVRTEDPQGTFRRDVQVSRVVVDAHVVDSSGDPIPGLGAADFEVLVDGKRAEVESVEWVPAGQSEFTPRTPAPGEPEGAQPVAPAGAPSGRVIVFFFQTDLQPLRLTGFMKMIQHARSLLDTLLPADRVAVVSFDSHLKLRQDFTGDRKKLEAAIFEAVKVGSTDEVAVSPAPSIARGFDFVAARKAATVEKGLALTAKALAPIPGAKTLLFFGWGLHVNRHPGESTDYGEALAALKAARLSVFSIDVTDADFHTLEGELELIADLTGGTYHKTHIFPASALERVARQISGRYVVVVIAPPGKRGRHDLELKLVGRKGRILSRNTFDD